MRVLISSWCFLELSRKAVLRARELGAAWARPDEIALLGEKEHHYGEDWESHLAEKGSTPEKIEYRRKHEEEYKVPSMLPRHDPILLQVFDELGQEMAPPDDSYREEDLIRCVEVPDDITYHIGEYICEWVAEQHRQWSGDTGFDGDLATAWCYAFTKETTYVGRMEEWEAARKEILEKEELEEEST